MTDQDTHTPTTQETQIYQALTEGDHDTIEDLRIADLQNPPDDQQFETDYSYAWSHYQADHEAPEAEREENTQEQVADQNQDANAASEGL